MFAWANLHGGFVLGLIIQSIFVAYCVLKKHRWRFPFLILALSFISTCINPYGPIVYWSYMIRALSMTRSTIPEWDSMFTDIGTLIPTLLILSPVVWGIFKKWPKVEHFGICFIAASAYFAFRHVRMLVFLMMTIAIFGSPYFSLFVDTLRARSRRVIVCERSGALVGLIATVTLTVLIVFRLLTVSSLKLDTSIYPVAATNWMRLHLPGGQLLVGFNEGSFALWRLYPKFTISMDGRYETVYPESTLTLNTAAFHLSSKEGREALATLHPTHILTSVESGVREALTLPENRAWSIVYSDEKYLLLGHVGENRQQGTNTDNQNLSEDLWNPLF